MLQETVVIEGEASLISQIDGDPSLLSEVDGDPNVVIAEGGGITPAGTIEITENGVYNVTEYASADVDVQGGITPTGTKQINITSNGTTTEDVTNYASASITTNVPASAVDTGTKSINSNGTHDVVGYASANVAVPASAVDYGTKSITSNGTHDVIGYASASVAVPNSYSASDEGKVVSNGALVAQTSDTVTANDTYDTTLINSLTVNVSGGGGFKCETGTFTLESDLTLNASKPTQSVPHTLGVVPDVVIVTFIPNNGTLTSDRGYIWLNRAVDLDQRVSSSAKTEYGIFTALSYGTVSNETCVTVSGSSSVSYGITSVGLPTASDFKLVRIVSSTVWSAGTYRYFVSEKWW